MATQFCWSTDGTRIAYDITGRGPALMLLHGGLKTRRDWHEAGYVRRLQPDFTVITVDIRGNGESDQLFSSKDYAIEKICADLIAVADACEAKEFAVWGFSFGGNIARYLAAWSDRVTAAAVIGVPLGPGVFPEFDQFINDFINKWKPLVKAYQQGTLGEDLPQKDRKLITRGLIPVWLACFSAIRQWPQVEPGDLRCPAMLLSGSKNKWVLEWIKGNRDSLDRAKIQAEIIEGLTHIQEFTQIERVFPVVSSFLKQKLEVKNI